MFRPVAMARLSAVVLERDERAVLRGLGRLGVMHLLRTRPGPDTAPLAPPDRTAELARCDELLARIDNLRRRLGVGPTPERAAEPVEITLEQIETGLKTLEEIAEHLLKRLAACEERASEVEAVLHRASPYEGLDLPIDLITQASFLHFAIGSLSEEDLAGLPGQLGENVILLPLGERQGRRHVVAISSRKGRFVMEAALEKAGFCRDTLVSESARTVEQLGEEARREKAAVAEELETIRHAIAGVAREGAQALANFDHRVTVERRVLEAEQHFPRTEATVLVTGWVPAEDMPALERHLHEITGGRCAVQAVDPRDVPEAEIPILLRHGRLLRPFEMLVTGYGLPAYREVEPTLFVAITYVIMFGMMFGDAGQGAVLALGGLLVLLKGRTAPVRDVGLLLLMVGLSSVAFGVTYGSYFGITELKGYALWHDPLEGDPMGVMYVAIGLGIVMMSVGLVLNVINRLRRGDVVGGLLDKFGVAGAVFYWGVLVLLVKSATFEEQGLVGLMIVLVIVAPLAAVAVKAPLQYTLSRRHGHAAHGGSLVEAILESAIEAFEAVIGYVANTVSFVRLAAYAMSHAALLMATFVIAAEMTKAWPGVLGSVLGVFVVVLGNLVAVLLEGIIASVQAVRLEYYEFFGKFFSGTGRAFMPFRFPTVSQGLTP